jgi:hypothetical protein
MLLLVLVAFVAGLVTAVSPCVLPILRSFLRPVRTNLENWYQKYAAEGFVIVGVHSPEFAFEHDTGNVQAAIARFGITYPVAQDNEFKTWAGYTNEYWPAHYLIDAGGNIRSEHFGEGDSAKTESEIRALHHDVDELFGHRLRHRFSRHRVQDERIAAGGKSAIAAG